MPDGLNSAFGADKPDLQIELTELTTKRLRGELSEQESERLESLVTASADGCRLFVQIGYETTVLLHYASHWRGVDAQTISHLLKSQSNESRRAETSLRKQPHTPHRSPLRFRLSTPSLVGWAACLLLIGYFTAVAGLLVWDHGRGRVARFEDSADTSSHFATLVSATDADWQKARNNERPEAYRRLVVKQGRAELQFADGTQVIVEGPADFEVQSRTGGYLHRGKLVALVPTQAVGFTIETPTTTVVDLGTEFGVQVSSAGSAEVHVFKGKVELRPVAGPTTLSSQPIVVSAGQARRIERSSSTGDAVAHEVKISPDKFGTPSSEPANAAAQPLRVEGVMASSTVNMPELKATNLIGGKGLVEDRHSANWQDAMWHTDYGRIENEFVLFDFRKPHRFSSMKVWNFNDAEAGRYAWIGVKQADIYVSTSGKGDPLSQPAEWKLVVANQAFGPGTGKADYNKPTTVELHGAEGRFVGIVIDDALGRDPHHPGEAEFTVVGLSEVQFFGQRIKAESRSSKHH